MSADNSTGSRGGDDTRAVDQAVDRVDDVQQRHRLLAVPVAVIRKFTEDQSTNLASMIAFWAFFSLFPLFLVFVTLLGFLLPADLKGTVLAHVASTFPLVDSSALHGLSGSWWALIVGLASALWSGLAVVRTAEVAFNAVWRSPTSSGPAWCRSCCGPWACWSPSVWGW